MSNSSKSVHLSLRLKQGISSRRGALKRTGPRRETKPFRLPPLNPVNVVTFFIIIFIKNAFQMLSPESIWAQVPWFNRGSVVVQIAFLSFS